MDLFEKYDKRTCKLANRIKAKSIDTVKSVQKIETLVELCQRWNCRNGSADNEALSKTAPCSPLGCCAEALEKDCYEHTATGKVCGLRAENSKENITTCIRRKKSSSTSSQQQDKKLNTSDSSTRIPNSSTVISSLATDGQFAFCQTMNRHRKLATIVFRFIMLTTFLLMLHIPMSAGSPITPHLNNLDINVQSFTAADTVANSEYQELHQGTPLAASSKNLNSGEQQQESAAKTYVWPTWLQSPPKETPVLRSRRQERATKRGLPPKYLTRHEFLQRLYSRNYYFLEILRNGKVRGTRNQNSSYSKCYLHLFLKLLRFFVHDYTRTLERPVTSLYNQLLVSIWMENMSRCQSV